MSPAAAPGHWRLLQALLPCGHAARTGLSVAARTAVTPSPGRGLCATAGAEHATARGGADAPVSGKGRRAAGGGRRLLSGREPAKAGLLRGGAWPVFISVTVATSFVR